MSKRVVVSQTLPPGITLISDNPPRYRIRINASHPLTGEKVDVIRRAPKGCSLDEAVARREELWAEITEGVQSPSNAPTTALVCPTMQEYSVGWLARKERTCKPSTYYQYHLGVHGQVLPRWGSTPLDQIARADLLRVRDGLEVDHPDLSPITIKNHWRIITTLIADACADFSLPDPSHRIQGPKVRRPTKRTQETLSMEDVHKVATAAMRSRSGYGVLVCVLAYTGMRRGEVIPLRWEDINLQDKIIHIRRSAVWVSGEWAVGLPKAGKARRVGIPPRLHAILSAAKKAADAHGVGGKGDLLTTTKEGGYPSPRSLRQCLERAGVAAGVAVKITPQVLRRSYNSIALGKIDRVGLQAMIGHMDDGMTAHYLHKLPADLADMAEAVWGAAEHVPLAEAETGQEKPKGSAS